MDTHQELVQQAKLLTKDKRQEILCSYSEVQLHKHLKSLFDRMEPNYRTAVTHGVNEFGKDLVIVKIDSLGVDVTAVVVKVGDIKAKTAGAVDQAKAEITAILKHSTEKKLDEIASQVQQALDHPAEIPSTFNALPVSKVMVIVCGEFSTHAKKRLTAEVQLTLADIRDIDWLIEKFTTHYPQIFFEQDVIDFLQARIQELEEQHFFGGKHINLSDYYVDPIVMKSLPLSQLDTNPIDTLIKRKRLNLEALKGVVLNNARIILLGDPSSGKSGAVIKLGIEMLREAAAEMFDGKGKGAIPVPVLTTARHLLNTPNVTDLLTPGEKVPELRDRIRIKVLIVDGLDEVPSSRRLETLDKAIQFSEALRSNLLITSRRIEQLKTTPKGFSQYELQPFQMNQAMKLFEKLTGNNVPKLKALKAGLEKFQSKVPMVPLSLIFLLELVEEKKEVPASVTELYERFSDIALGRYDKEKGIEVLFEYLIKKRFMASLAFKSMLSEERVELERTEFDDFLNAYANDFDWDQDYAHSFVKEIERTGIIQIGETVQFKHRTFLDYLAAYYIHEERDNIQNVQDFITRICFDDNWGDSAFFSIGLRRDFPEQIIDKFFEFKKDGTRILMTKLGVGKLLQAGWHSKASVRKRCIQAGLALVPKVRDALGEIKLPNGAKLPAFGVDILLFAMAEVHYASVFLYKDLLENLKQCLHEPTDDNITRGLFVLFALRDLLPLAERDVYVDRLIEILESHGTIETRARTLLFLSAVKKDDKPFVKKLRAKTNALTKRNPDIMKEILGIKA